MPLSLIHICNLLGREGYLMHTLPVTPAQLILSKLISSMVWLLCSIDVYKRQAHIRFASLLGCGMVGTETGAPNAEYKFCPECRSDAALALSLIHIFLNMSVRCRIGFCEIIGYRFSILI